MFKKYVLKNRLNGKYAAYVRLPKCFLCFNCQAQLLRKRKLKNCHTAEALKLLKRYNYYRLTGYLYKDQDKKTNDYHNVTLDDLKNRYALDADLRRIIFKTLEYCEIQIRTNLAYVLGEKYGPLGYLDPANFNSKDQHDIFLANLINRKQRSENKEIYKHHKKYYGFKFPIWALVELLTFEDLAFLYRNMKQDAKESVCLMMSSVNTDIMGKWIFSLINLRNQCAHFSRIYNISTLGNVNIDYNLAKYKIHSNSLFANILIAKYILKNNIHWENFIQEISDFLLQYKIRPQAISFPPNWKRICNEEINYKTKPRKNKKKPLD